MGLMEGKMGKLIDCRPIQESIKTIIKKEIQHNKIKPVLTIIQVGEDYASTKYVGQKIKHATEVGITPNHVKLPESITTEELVSIVLNEQAGCNAIIVQLPLPAHIDEFLVLNHIESVKDADCLTLENIALLHTGESFVEPCTARGVIDILNYHEYDFKGKNVLILGRGYMAGYPLFKMMLDRDCTVTLAHSKSDIDYYTSLKWDVIVACVGKAKHFKNLKSDWIVDVGINYDENGKMCGDIDTENCEYNFCTLVPRGVGTMTVASLLLNTLKLTIIQKKENYSDYIFATV